MEIIQLLATGPKTHAEVMSAVSSPQTAWRRLKEMAEGGLLIRTEVSSLEVYYNIDVARLQDVIDFLSELAAQIVPVL